MQAERLVTMSGARDARVLWFFAGGLAGLLAWSKLFESLAAGDRVEDLAAIIERGCGLTRFVLSSRAADVHRKKHNPLWVHEGPVGAEVLWCERPEVWTDCAELAETLLTGGNKQILGGGPGYDAEVHLERWDQPWSES